MIRRPPRSTLFPTRRSSDLMARLRDLRPDFLFSFYFKHLVGAALLALPGRGAYNLHGSLLPKYRGRAPIDRKSTRLNSSHQIISYAVFCLKKKKITIR